MTNWEKMGIAFMIISVSWSANDGATWAVASFGLFATGVVLLMFGGE